MASKSKIRRYPNPVLRQPCAAVVDFDRHLADLVHCMKLAMVSEKGVGLAAPQIGVSKRVILVRMCPMVNPEIIELAGEPTLVREGCLSFPGQQVWKRRYPKVRVRFQNLSGHQREERRSGLEAQIVQHEVDHLNGVLLCDTSSEECKAAA